MSIVHYAKAMSIESEALDYYGKRGVVLSRDSASVVQAALQRDAAEMEHRGGEANLAAALEQRMLAREIVKALNA